MGYEGFIFALGISAFGAMFLGIGVTYSNSTKQDEKNSSGGLIGFGATFLTFGLLLMIFSILTSLGLLG
jgi:hypothetical protein